MSETETETPDETEPDIPLEEPEPETEPADEPPDAGDADEADDEETLDDDAAESESLGSETEPSALSQKELEKLNERLVNEGTRHRNRVSEIMGEAANDLLPCPMCSEWVDGLIPPVMPPEDVVQRVRAAIGLPDMSAFNRADFARRCETCGGLGVVLTGSLVQGNEAIKCRACNGSGYIVVHGPTGEVSAGETSNGGADTPLLEGVNPDDPAIAELRARGFTVVPPIRIESPGG